jgi:hypothetical protein
MQLTVTIAPTQEQTQRRGGWFEKPDRVAIVGGVFWEAKFAAVEQADVVSFTGTVEELQPKET